MPPISSQDAQAEPVLALRLRVRAGPHFDLAVDADLPARGVTVVFGPSGCGKTTLLRAVAGLTRPPPGRGVALGRVALGREVWQDDAQGIWLAAHRRAVGMVFQQANLFAHLTAGENLQFALARVPPGERRIALDQAVALLGIGPLLARRPGQLSGGERQRVAIARALAASPRLLLLDEPLASLDAARKAELLPYFERIQRELALPMLYVTHAPDELARLADQVLLLHEGRVRAQGPAGEMLARMDWALEQADAAGALIEGVVEAFDETWRLLHVRFAGGVVRCVSAPGAAPRAPGQRVRLRVPARDVSLTLTAAGDTSILNVLPATVTELADDGPAQTLVALQAGGAPLMARVTRKSAHQLGLRPGLAVFAQIKGVALLD
ncbi:MAG: molybdenum ABC transporter ATP-binding protein [Burkholderiaceae bacterium]|jgi:molybdate transport system ATP-binding protein|nr:molybdenum ABC transporter ATP-binding protein [Burkholderiaceae bacterium]